MRKHLLPFLAMALLMTAPFGAKAQQGIENYVSASGYVIYHAPSVYSPNGVYAWDFEQDFEEGRILDWTLIDADGDSHNWQLPSTDGMGHGSSDGMLVSYSYDNASTSPLTPNNYLVSPRINIPEGSMISFWACAMDEAYPAEHFAVAISTTVNNNPSAFTTLQEWTLTAKDQGNRQGNWHQYSVDLSAYAGQEAYLAIRHFNCSDMFAICVDDVYIGDDNATALVGSDIILDGQLVATNQHGTHYLLNTEGFADGSNHTTTIRAHYQSGATVEDEYAWTYRTPDHFQGSPNGLQAQSDGSTVQLSWTLPTMSAPFPLDELYYDFADSTLMDLTLIDANNDGQNFRVYPWSGFGGGIGLRSFSWMSGPGPLNPDNYIVTPRLTATADARISFMACDADMPGIAPDPEHFGVAVSTSGNTNPADFTMIQEWNSTGSYTEYSVDLSAYAGQQIYIAIRHFNTTGETYFLCVDDIKVTGIEAEVMRPAIGALVYANDELIATLNHGETSFTHEVNRYTSNYCIRIIQEGSRETGNYYALAAPQCAAAELDCVAPKNLRAENLGDKVRISWEREIYTGFEEDPQGWTFLDADGDGFNFGIYAAGGMNSDGSVNTTGTNASLTSFSYNNSYGALQPDNYAFMPRIKVMENASMTFYAAGFDPSYAVEHFGVAVASADGLNIATIAEWDSRNPYQAFSVDLSAYEGQEIYLGFRHFTNVSNYALCIDNITVTNVVWSGTTSQTYGYYVYRSTDGQIYELIGVTTGTVMHFDDNDTSADTYYYQVTAINTIVGGDCESAPAMSADGIHDYVTAHTDGIKEMGNDINVYPNPTEGILFVETRFIASQPSAYRITNAMGQTVLMGQITSEPQQIDVSNLPQGMYFIAIDGVTQKFVVK
ncbi:MAG: choice-of-anchor J domain-containing protein [Bacteroidales bacterium]|nr:choice-of-anchor J domain-containing protein [Bacteroidales bacterium]